MPITKSEPRVDKLHIDRRIRRVLAFEIFFVFALYIILFVGSNIFLAQQNKLGQQVQSRFQMMVTVQNLERLLILNNNLVHSYRVQPTDQKFDSLVKNHTDFGQQIDGTKNQLAKLTTPEAAHLTDEKSLAERLTQNYLKIISASNALLGKDVLSPVAAYKVGANGERDLPAVTSDKTPDELDKTLTDLQDDSIGITDNWRTLAEQDISRLQQKLQLSQKLRAGILLIQALLVIIGLAVMSYSYVLPAFERILKQVILQNEELLKADDTKTEFISIASHQLRTPLSVIKWSLSLLLKPEPNTMTPQQREMVSQAKMSAETVIKLVGNLLNLSRIEQGRLAYHPVPTDVVPIIHQIVNDIKPMALAHKVTVTTELAEPTMPLLADPLLFTEVVQNLVDNAIAYNRPNGVVKIMTHKKAGYWVIDVADTGFGIMPEDIKSLFTKFFRGMNAKSIRPDGSGLGLYFIQKIVHLHEGKITVESEPNQGTIFSVYIPRPKAQALAQPPEPVKVAGLTQVPVTEAVKIGPIALKSTPPMPVQPVQPVAFPPNTANPLST